MARKFGMKKIGLATRDRFSSNLSDSELTGDIAGCGWSAARPDHAGLWKIARRGTRRPSAYSGCKPPRGRAGRREPRQRLRPCGGSPTVWSRARADPQLLTDYRQAR